MCIVVPLFKESAYQFLVHLPRGMLKKFLLLVPVQFSEHLVQIGAMWPLGFGFFGRLVHHSEKQESNQDLTLSFGTLLQEVLVSVRLDGLHQSFLQLW